MYDIRGMVYLQKHISYTLHHTSKMTGRWKDYVQSKIKNLKQS